MHWLYIFTCSLNSSSETVCLPGLLTSPSNILSSTSIFGLLLKSTSFGTIRPYWYFASHPANTRASPTEQDASKILTFLGTKPPSMKSSTTLLIFSNLSVVMAVNPGSTLKSSKSSSSTTLSGFLVDVLSMANGENHTYRDSMWKSPSGPTLRISASSSLFCVHACFMCFT